MTLTTERLRQTVIGTRWLSRKDKKRILASIDAEQPITIVLDGETVTFDPLYADRWEMKMSG
jgi:hypothetical protein